MGASAALWGPLIGAAGSVISADAQRDAAKRASGAGVNVPGDIWDLRRWLAALGTTQLTRPGAPGQLGLKVPTAQTAAIEGLFRERLDPDFLDQLNQDFNAFDQLDELERRRQPLLAENLKNFSDATISRFGATGNRAGSSDFQRFLSQGAGDAARQFSADIAGFFPQLQANQLAARQLGMSAQDRALGIPALLQSHILNPISAFLPLATAGVGGTNAAAAASFGGPSPLGAGMTNVSDTLFLQSLLK